MAAFLSIFKHLQVTLETFAVFSTSNHGYSLYWFFFLGYPDFCSACLPSQEIDHAPSTANAYSLHAPFGVS